MNRYPQRIWKVSSSPAGIIAREYGARETDTMFKVSSDGCPPEKNVKKADLDRIQHDRGDCFVWVLEEDDLQSAVDRVRLSAKGVDESKIDNLKVHLEALNERPRVARYEHHDEVFDFEPTDDMF